MLELIRENLILMLTGSTMAFFGGIIYVPVGKAFLSGGQFRSKEVALLIFLISIPITAFVTLIVQRIWISVTAAVSFIQLVGLVLILAMLGVNYIVTNWRFTDFKSIMVYLFGFLLIYLF